MERGIGAIVVVVGLLVVVVGVLISVGAMGWFGNLPGDLRGGGDRTRVFFPITSMILVSIVLTVVVNVALRLFR